jgi:hypothetical protein
MYLSLGQTSVISLTDKESLVVFTAKCVRIIMLRHPDSLVYHFASGDWLSRS